MDYLNKKFRGRSGATVVMLLVVVAIVAIVATLLLPSLLATPPLRQSRTLTINSVDQQPSYIGVAPVGTNNLLELYQGSNKRFAVGSNGIPSPFEYGTLVMSSDGSATQTFSKVFRSAPAVVTRQFGAAAGSLTNQLSVTESNFVLRTSIASQSNTWQSIGPP